MSSESQIKEIDKEIEANLRAEYDQTWQDFRHRTTVQMTILGVYFATVTGLIYVFEQAVAVIQSWVGFLVGIIGIILSLSTLLLLLGERRAWSADLTRLQELELLLSHRTNSRTQPERKLRRITDFEPLWTKLKYDVSIGGSFLWYLIVVISTGAVLFSFGLHKALNSPVWLVCIPYVLILAFFAGIIFLAMFTIYIMRRTAHDH
jgi:hypothetical protein